MTPKDFQMIARRIADSTDLYGPYGMESNDVAYRAVQAVAVDLAAIFQDTHMPFERARFLEECGIE